MNDEEFAIMECVCRTLPEHDPWVVTDIITNDGKKFISSKKQRCRMFHAFIGFVIKTQQFL